MPDVREYQSVMEEAERAARAGDFARADALLREALALQEAALGPSHPELASTLNNLAVVCETTGHMEDAERFYRRAYAVASAALPPTDPLVETSRENLKDFCAARGLLLDERPGIRHPEDAPERRAVSPVTAAPPPVAVSAPDDPTARPAPAAVGATRAAPPAGPPTKGWPRGVIAVVALLAVVGAFVVARSWLPGTADQPAETSAAPSPAPSPPPDPAASAPTASSPVASSPVAAGVPAAAAPTSPPAPAAPPAAAPPRPGAAPAGVRVLVADVCRTLTRSGAWRCDPLGSTAAPGPASFYTRLASPTALRVQHRWYQGTTVRQSVTLSIGANPTAGYRTFSRQTLTPGSWRVELRGADGTVLHTSSFEVR